MKLLSIAKFLQNCSCTLLDRQSVYTAYLPEDLEVFLFDSEQFAVFASDHSWMPWTVVEYRLAERSTHTECAQCHRVL